MELIEVGGWISWERLGCHNGDERKRFFQSVRALPWSLAPVAVRVKRGSVTEEMIPLMRVGISSEKVEEEEEEGEVELL